MLYHTPSTVEEKMIKRFKMIKTLLNIKNSRTNILIRNYILRLVRYMFKIIVNDLLLRNVDDWLLDTDDYLFFFLSKVFFSYVIMKYI